MAAGLGRGRAGFGPGDNGFGRGGAGRGDAGFWRGGAGSFVKRGEEKDRRDEEVAGSLLKKLNNIIKKVPES